MKNFKLSIFLFAIILLLQSCGEKTYLDVDNVNDILLKGKVDNILNKFIKSKNSPIISYEYAPIQTPIEFFQSSIKSSVCEKITLQPNVTCKIQYKEGKEIETCEAMAYYLVKENTNGLGYCLVGEGVILTTSIRFTEGLFRINGNKQQALGYGAISTNLFNYVWIIFSIFPLLLLFSLAVEIASRIEFKSNAIILAVCISIVLLSVIFGIYWLLRISIAASAVVCSFFLYQYSSSNMPEYKTRLEWINGTPMNVMYETKSDASFSTIILAIVFAVIFDILAIVVLFLNNNIIFEIGHYLFNLVCTLVCSTILIFVLYFVKRIK
jgi:hypothetical protein